MVGRLTIKAFMTFSLICLLLTIVPSAAFSWGDAIHVYISDRLNAEHGYKNMNEMWGSLGPDIFNFIFDPNLCPAWLADQTHTDSFMKVWDKADTISEKALAYGFVSHNEAWGADYTAHVSGLTFGQAYGYINTKAMVLLNTSINPAEPHDPILNPKLGEIFASIGMNDEQQLMVTHVIAEYAIDIMFRNDVDPFIGVKMKVAALTRSKKFPALLIDAYASDYATTCDIDYPTAANIITSAEDEYRNSMVSYGKVILQSEPVAVQLIARQIVALAPGFLGGPLPIPEADAIELVKAAIYVSMEICSDYMTEINETIEYVNNNLTNYGITY